MINISIQGQKLKVKSDFAVSDTIAYLEAKFIFSSDWNGTTKYAHLLRGKDEFIFELYNDKITQDRHLDLSAGSWGIFVHGERYANGELVQRITTDIEHFQVVKTGKLGGGIYPPNTPSEIEQIHATINHLQSTINDISAQLQDRSSFETKIVDTLPTEDISDSTIYMLKTERDGTDIYDEYVYVNGTWEQIGGQSAEESSCPTDDEWLIIAAEAGLIEPVVEEGDTFYIDREERIYVI